jgi:hypothetical protein
MKQPANRKLIEDRLEIEIEKLRAVSDRDPESVTRGKAQFLAEARNMHESVSPNPFRRLNEWLQKTFIGFRKERSPMFGTISAVILALALVFGGGGATVYAAQDSMPDDLLYPLKLFSEDAQLNFAGDSQNQVQLLEQFIHRRFEEIDGLAIAGEGIPPDVVNRLQLQLETQLRLVAGMDDGEMQQTLAQLQLMIQTQEQKMTMLGQPDQADPQLEQVRTIMQERLRLIQTGLDDPNMLRFQLGLQQNQPTEPPQGPPEDSNGQDTGENTKQPGAGPCEDCTPAGDGSGVGAGSQGPKETQQPEGNGPGGPNEEPGSGNGAGQQANPSCTPAQDGSGSENSGPKATEKPTEDKGKDSDRGQNGSQDEPGNDDGGSGVGGNPQVTQEPPGNQGGSQEPPEGSGGSGGNGSGGNGGKP